MVLGDFMKPEELLSNLEAIASATPAAVLCTTDSRGKGFIRWMTPVVMKYRPGMIYTFSAPNAAKIGHIEEGSDAEWMFQGSDLREIINIRGAIKAISNPELKAELLYMIAPKMYKYWKSDAKPGDLVILETIIEEAIYYLPLEGTRQLVHFT